MNGKLLLVGVISLLSASIYIYHANHINNKILNDPQSTDFNVSINSQLIAQQPYISYIPSNIYSGVFDYSQYPLTFDLIINNDSINYYQNVLPIFPNSNPLAVQTSLFEQLGIYTQYPVDIASFEDLLNNKEYVFGGVANNEYFMSGYKGIYFSYSPSCLSDPSICNTNESFPFLYFKNSYYYPESIGQKSNGQLIVSYEALNGNPIGVIGSNAISRVLIGPETIDAPAHFGIFNLFVSNPGDSNFYSIISQDGNLIKQFYKYIGQPMPNINQQYNMPMVFLSNPVNKSYFYLQNNTAFPSIIDPAILSDLYYIPSQGNYYNLVVAPYLIQLPYSIGGALLKNGGSAFNMPVMVIGYNNITVFGTSIIFGYNISDNKESNTILWITGPGIGYIAKTYYVNGVRPLSPYAHVYYVTPQLGNISTNSNIIPVNYTIITYDPEDGVLQYITLHEINVTESTNTNYPFVVNMLPVSISAKVFTISSLAGNMNTYVDLDYINEGYIILYTYENNEFYIYVVNINSGQISKYTISQPIPNLISLSSPNIEGLAYPILSAIQEVNNNIQYVNYKPYIYIGGMNITSIEKQLQYSLNVSYTVADLPVVIVYNASSGSESANDVLVQINITNPQFLSYIATPDARDIRIFESQVSNPSLYYQDNSLTYAIEKYKPGQLLELLVLLPQINATEPVTLYIYAGYPYARPVYVSANTLLDQYTLLQQS